MGTRSLTHIKSGHRRSKTLVTFYRQFDGYVCGHGHDMAKFLVRGRMTNGISDMAEIVFNGMGGLAMLLLAHLKIEQTSGTNKMRASAPMGTEKDRAPIEMDPSGFYLEHPDATECGEEYVYTIFWNPERSKHKKKVHRLSGDVCIKVERGYGREWLTIFEGTPAQLLEFKEEVS